MPELPELEVVQEVLNRHKLGQTIASVEAGPPGAAIVIRDLTGAGFGAALADATVESVIRRVSNCGGSCVTTIAKAQPC